MSSSTRGLRARLSTVRTRAALARGRREIWSRTGTAAPGERDDLAAVLRRQ